MLGPPSAALRLACTYTGVARRRARSPPGRTTQPEGTLTGSAERIGNYRVERGAVELKAEGVPGYAVSVSETIEPVEPAAPSDAGATP